jgi:SAM-dependent methyltransferase
MTEKNDIHILDIGCGGGDFALALYSYFQDKGINIKIYCLDNEEYQTWHTAQYSISLIFIKGSAVDLCKIFDSIKFDLVFCNRVFHHFVLDSWRKSYDCMRGIMRQIVSVLKHDGFICITDYYYNGLFFDTSSSRIIYFLTSLKIPLLIKLFRKFESKSAGVGVCFLSKQMWFSMFNDMGLDVEYIKETGRMLVRWNHEIIYKLFLLLKFRSEDNIFIVKKREHP